VYRVFIVLFILGIPLGGCAEKAVEADPNYGRKIIQSKYSNCDQNILFTNNTTQLFKITNIVRESKSHSASLAIDNKEIWAYRGYQYSKSSHKMNSALIINPTESVVCDHEGYLLTIIGYFAPISEEP
jgi:hypothetical protein